MRTWKVPFLIVAIVIAAQTSLLASPSTRLEKKAIVASNAAGRRRSAVPPARFLTPEVMLGNSQYQSYGPAVVALGISGGVALWEASSSIQGKTSYLLMESPITSAGELTNPVGEPLILPSEHIPGRVALSFLQHSDTGIVAWVDPAGKGNASRIRADGQLLDSQPLLLPDTNVRDVGVTCGDDDCLVLWLGFGDFYGNGAMKGTRVSANGSLLDPQPMNIGGWQSGISAVWTGTEYWIVRNLILPTQSDALILEVLPLRGSALGAPIASINSLNPSIGKGSIAWNGFEALLSWYSTVSDQLSAHNDVRYSRIDRSGRLLDGPQGVLIGTAPPPRYLTDSGSPTPWDGQVTWDGTSFVVTWEGRKGATYLERITSEGQRLDGDFPNAGFILPAPAPAAVIGIGLGQSLVSYEPSLGPSRIRILKE